MAEKLIEEPMELLEQRGLGKKFGEFPMGIGILDIHLKHLNLMTDGQGGFNVMIMDNQFLYRDPSEVYLFPSMVTEEEARQKYNEYVVPSLREGVLRDGSSQPTRVINNKA